MICACVTDNLLHKGVICDIFHDYEQVPLNSPINHHDICMPHLTYPATPSTGNVSILDSGSFCQAYDAARHLARRDFSEPSSSTSLLTFFCTLPPSPLFTSALLAFTSARVVVCARKVLYCRSYTLLASLITLCTSF